MDKSLCEYFYEPSGVEGHRCGYCKSEGTNISNGMWAHQLTCEDYQDLIDRGWRRSGKYCYKPVMDKTCCPLYTIRCEAPKFQLSKSQKKVLKRMNNYLSPPEKKEDKKKKVSKTKKGDKDKTATGKREEREETVSESDVVEQPDGMRSENVGILVDTDFPKDDAEKEDKDETTPEKREEKVETASEVVEQPDGATPQNEGKLIDIDVPMDDTSSTAKDDATKGKKVVRKGDGPDPKKPQCLKAKVVRLERKLQKQKLAAAKEMGKETTKKDTKPKHNHPASKMKSETEKGKKPNDQIPGFLKIGPDGRKPLEMFLPPPATGTKDDRSHFPQRQLEISLIRSSPPSQQFKDTYEETFILFQKYQMAIHGDTKDECDEKMYNRFLCDSPLMRKPGATGWSYDYGSYHQHYRIDGKLVAVGVVDILPKCLSSVYVFYDPDYNFLSLGVYSALRELELTRKLHLSAPDTFIYYYMGYYVHSCQKMRYKGQYTPSFLLCPVTYRYVPIERCRPKIDVSKFSKFYEEAVEEEDVEEAMGSTVVMVQRNLLTYALCKMVFGGDHEDKVREYVRFVGKNVASRMILFLVS